MLIHFNHTEAAAAPAGTLFDVLTDYEHYPQFNPAVESVEVTSKTAGGAQFRAGRKTRVEKNASADDQYTQDRGRYVIERSYGSDTDARSTWTVSPIDENHCSFEIDASMTVPLLKGLVMKPLLRRLFYSINFSPFITEAEHRASGATP